MTRVTFAESCIASGMVNVSSVLKDAFRGMNPASILSSQSVGHLAEGATMEGRDTYFLDLIDCIISIITISSYVL